MSVVNFSGTATDFDTAHATITTQLKPLLLKDGLMAAVQPLTGLAPWAVTWDKDPQPMVSDLMRAKVTMSLKNSDFAGGADDKRRTYDPDTDTYVLEMCGQRTLILTLKCEVYDKSAEAYEILERVRALLHANFELTPLGLSYINANIINDLPTTYDNRVVNVAVLELTLGAVSNYVARQQIGQGWIDTVNTTNAVPGDYT